MSTLLAQIKWQFIILQRNNIISLSIIVTFFYGLIFWLIKDIGNVDKVLTLLILNDPTIIGLFFIGVSIIIEKNQNVLSALFITPINYHIYLISRIISLSLIGWICALGMGYSALGSSFNLLPFSVGVLGVCIIACLIGIYLVCYETDFLKFLLKSIPILLLFFNLPLLNYFEVTNISFFYLSPTQGSLNLISYSYNNPYSTSEILYSYGIIVMWILLLYRFVYRTFISKMVNT